MNKKAILIVLGISAGLFPILTASGYSIKPKSVKNIILMIGDGMGTAQVYSGYVYNKGSLNFQRFRTSGFSITNSTSFVTDSGAGATAISAGKKTYNGAIGVDSTGQPVKTILEWAEDFGKATGLVATCAITHATPASFISHQAQRSDYELIAADFLKTDIDLFVGGGRNHFIKRKDSTNLVQKLTDKGYKVVYTTDELKTVASLPVAALLDTLHQPRWSEGREDQLPESVGEALRLLSADPDGFFLMVEGSQIDWGSHDNNIGYVAQEVADFDRAIGVALDFAQQNGETLVIVTADHETGGLTLNDGKIPTGDITSHFTTTNHTGVMVPLFAYGPYSETFGGMQQNTDIFNKMIKAFGFLNSKNKK
ncbi:MAG: alkaline phosphatase [Bacteroidota bacterium]